MARADSEILDLLHNLTAERLVDYLQNGYPTGEIDEETGVEVRGPVPAAVLAQATKFLKDNGIEAVPTPNSPLDELTKTAMPTTFGEEDGDFAEDMPVRPGALN